MAKPEKKYECLNKEQKSFLKKALGIRKLEDLDLSILKELKERLKLLKETSMGCYYVRCNCFLC